MSESEQERHDDEDDEVDPTAHRKLLQAIGKLGKTQHIRKPTRSEPALARDEFHLVKPLSTEVQTLSMGDVIGLLKKTSGHIKAGKELSKSQQRKKVLNKPLEKPVAERIQRTIGYEKAKKSLSRWDAIVERNRVAEQQVFPLDYEEVHVVLPAPKKPPATTIKSDLMLEMEAVEAKLRSLKGANQNEETNDEQKQHEKLTREELIARRKELAYLRVKESQKSARARLQNKIKSKKYHKVMKREKLKEQIKEFELLQKTNPEAALEKLESIEKTRVLERASLRHKNTGTWAKNLQIRAKYDKDVRKDLGEQLALSRELTQKQQADEDSESGDDDEDDKKVPDGNYDPLNPWFGNKKNVEQSAEVMEYMSGYRKYWMERNKNEKALEEFRSESNGVKKDDKQSDKPSGKKPKAKTKSKSKKPTKKTRNPKISDKKLTKIAPSVAKDDSKNEGCDEEFSENELEQLKALLNNSEQSNKINDESSSKENRKRRKTSKSAAKPALKNAKKMKEQLKTSSSKVKQPKSKTSERSATNGVEVIEDASNTNIDIDDIFDDAENHLEKRVSEKEESGKKPKAKTKSKSKKPTKKTRNPKISDKKLTKIAPSVAKDDSKYEGCDEEFSENELEQFKALLNNSEQSNKINDESSSKENRKRPKTSKSAAQPALKNAKKIKKQLKTSSSKVKQPKSKTSERSATNGVEVIEDASNTNIDIDDIFDDAENHLEKRVSEKIAALSGELNPKKPSKITKKKGKVEKKKGKKKTNSKDLSFKVQPFRPEIDEQLLETQADETTTAQNQDSYRLANSKIASQSLGENRIDPNNIAQIKPKALKTALPDMVNSEDFFDEHEAASKMQMTIAEAFEDDDIVADFEQDRDDERKKSSNAEVDLTLPGWGSWAGCGISTAKKTKKLILKFPKDAPRRDDSKHNVYINESGSKSVKQHLVSDLPFPFKSVEDYEASIRAPTGRSFVPETAFRILTRPAVVTKLGAPIEPMSDEHLVKMPKRPRTVVDYRILKMSQNKA